MLNNPDLQSRIKWMHAYNNEMELAERYDLLANVYEEKSAAMGWVAPDHVINDFFIRYVPNKQAKVLNAGVRTGLVGELLHQHIYTDIVGVDISANMVAKA